MLAERIAKLPALFAPIERDVGDKPPFLRFAASTPAQLLAADEAHRGDLDRARHLAARERGLGAADEGGAPRGEARAGLDRGGRGVADRELDLLPGIGARTAIPLASARGGELGMGAVLHRRADLQLVAAGDAGRRVEQDRLTHGVAFRVKRLLDPQRAEMPVFAQHGAFAGSGEAQLQFGMPGRRGVRKAGRHGQECGGNRRRAEYAGIRRRRPSA